MFQRQVTMAKRRYNTKVYWAKIGAKQKHWSQWVHWKHFHRQCFWKGQSIGRNRWKRGKWFRSRRFFSYKACSWRVAKSCWWKMSCQRYWRRRVLQWVPFQFSKRCYNYAKMTKKGRGWKRAHCGWRRRTDCFFKGRCYSSLNYRMNKYGAWRRMKNCWTMYRNSRFSNKLDKKAHHRTCRWYHGLWKRIRNPHRRVRPRRRL